MLCILVDETRYLPICKMEILLRRLKVPACVVRLRCSVGDRNFGELDWRPSKMS